jgi:DNA-binding HxlR family transcriptional regulator
VTKLQFPHHLCPKFLKAMAVLARPWNGLIIATLEQGPSRFSELGSKLEDLGDRMLALRLKELEQLGLVVRTVQCGPPVRVEYALTDVGRGFREVEAAIQRWGEGFGDPQPGSARPAKSKKKAAGPRKAGPRKPRVQRAAAAAVSS